MSSSAPILVTLAGMGSLEHSLWTLAMRLSYRVLDAYDAHDDLDKDPYSRESYERRMRVKLYALARGSTIEDVFDLPCVGGRSDAADQAAARHWVIGSSAGVAATR